MKKILLFSILFGCIVLPTKSQTYYPIPTTDMHWNARVFNIFVSFWYEYEYGTFGDTTINSTVYYKLQRYTEPFGYFREVNKKVYFRDNYNTEILLYDFSLNIGDSIQFGNYFLDGDKLQNGGYPRYMFLKNIDSVLIADSNRAIYNYTSSSGSFQFIEGIGNINGYGFIDQLIQRCTCGDVITFHYAKLNDTYLIHNYLAENILTPAKDNKISVYPNPFRNYAKIEFTTPLANGQVKVINSSGKEVFNRDVANETEIFLYKNNLKPGIYILQITDWNQVVLQKKLVIEN